MGTILARDLTVGTIVYLKESGVNVPYIVADTANGTVLVRQNLLGSVQMYEYTYGIESVTFQTTAAYTYLQKTYYPSLGVDDKNAIIGVSIPTKEDLEGGLAYFSDASKRIAKTDAGVDNSYWTSTMAHEQPGDGYTWYRAYAVNSAGGFYSTYCTSAERVRPKVTIFQGTMFDDATLEVVGLEEPELPSGYTRQKGLISAGNGEYIKTALKPSKYAGFELKFRLNKLGKIQYLFGTSYPTATCTYAYVNAENKVYVQHGPTNSSAISSATLKVGEEYTLRLENETWTLNGTQIRKTENTYATQSYVVYVFAVNSQNKPSGYGDITVLSFKAFSAGITNYYVPAEGPDGLGLYDLVGGGMLYNAGTGQFTVPKEPRVSKVEMADGEVLIDLTGTSVAEDTLIEGTTAVDRTGNLIVGTASAGSATPMATGVYAPTSSVTTFTISGLEFKPKVVTIVAESSGTYAMLALYRSEESTTAINRTLYTGNTASTATNNASTQYITMNSDGFTARTPGTSYTYYRGYNYRWFAMG